MRNDGIGFVQQGVVGLFLHIQLWRELTNIVAQQAIDALGTKLSRGVTRAQLPSSWRSIRVWLHRNDLHVN
jgi:hypothetical protein